MSTIVKTLTVRERQVLEGLADGSTLAAVAFDLAIRQSTATGYLRLAKRKLGGVSENAAALAIGYATDAISCPELLSPEELRVPAEQRELVPLIAQGMTAMQMATQLKRPLPLVRRDTRHLLQAVLARNPAHLVTRAWQTRLLTAEHVMAWIR